MLISTGQIRTRLRERGCPEAPLYTIANILDRHFRDQRIVLAGARGIDVKFLPQIEAKVREHLARNAKRKPRTTRTA
jgi:hypothetical protein